MALLGLGLSFWWALLLTPLLMAVIGYVTERALIQRVFHSKDRHTLTLLLTFGIGIVLEDVLKIVFGANPLRIDAPITGATEMVGLFFPNYRLFVMGFGGAADRARSGCWCSARRLGAMVRAAAFDRHMTRLAGRAGVARSMPAPLPSAWRWPGWPACCWRRSIRSSRRWGATSC